MREKEEIRRVMTVYEACINEVMTVYEACINEN